MPTDPAPQGVGSRRLERYLAIIVGVFGLLYALQTADALSAGWPGMSGPAGVVAVTLVAVSVLAGCSAVVAAVPTRVALGGALGAFAGALVFWSIAQHGPAAAGQMPWFTAVAGAPVAYAVVAVRRPAVSAAIAVLGAAFIAAVGAMHGGRTREELLVDAFFLLAQAILLSLLVSTLRGMVRRADDAQRVALAGFGRSRQDEATETERVRTDALVHDCVLTTFLSAASAQNVETEQLSAHMAANALRVLQHVNREGETGAVVALARAIAEAQERLTPLTRYFEFRTDGTEDVVLPVEVADTMLDAMAHAMANSVTYAGHADRTVRMSRLGPDGLRIIVADDGVGFDPGRVAGTGGLQRSIVQRLRAVDGRADITSAPGNGCTVVLSWGSVVIHGVAPLPVEIAGRRTEGALA